MMIVILNFAKIRACVTQELPPCARPGCCKGTEFLKSPGETLDKTVKQVTNGWMFTGAGRLFCLLKLRQTRVRRQAKAAFTGFV